MGEDVCVATDLRARIRRHPSLALALGAFLGFVGAPLILRTAKRALTVTATIKSLTSARSRSLPELVLTSLRGGIAPR